MHRCKAVAGMPDRRTLLYLSHVLPPRLMHCTGLHKPLAWSSRTPITFLKASGARHHLQERPAIMGFALHP